MSSLNKVQLIGIVVKEPEIKHLEAGYIKVSLLLVTTEIFKNREGQRQEQTEWHNIIAWRGLAENLEKSLIKKGTLVYVEGKIRTRMYEDKEGAKKYVTEIVADVVSILKRPSNDENNTALPEFKSVIIEETPGPAGDLPF